MNILIRKDTPAVRVSNVGKQPFQQFLKMRLLARSHVEGSNHGKEWMMMMMM